MTWLITGGCGFIGSNLADTLMVQGESVVLFDNLSRLGSKDNLKWLRDKHGQIFEFIQADIRNAADVERTVNQFSPTVIAHLAGQVAMTTSLQNPRLDFETNALGTLNVLEAVRLHSPKAIVLYSSTNKVYGSLEDLHYEETPTRYILLDYPEGLNETTQLDGHSPYGCSKLSGDQYVRDYHRMFGLKTVVFRHSSMYGGRQYATYDQGWIGWFCQKALEMQDPERTFTISGSGKQVRDVLHAQDLIRVYMLAADHINVTAGQIYNIGGGQSNSLSLIELFGMLESISGYKMNFARLEWRAGDQKVFVANTSKAQHDFGWTASVNAEVGIRSMMEWCREIQHGNS